MQSRNEGEEEEEEESASAVTSRRSSSRIQWTTCRPPPGSRASSVGARTPSPDPRRAPRSRSASRAPSSVGGRSPSPDPRTLSAAKDPRPSASARTPSPGPKGAVATLPYLPEKLRIVCPLDSKIRIELKM